VWHCEIPGGKNIYVGLYNQGKDPWFSKQQYSFN
jgi:hypothetical protein